MKLLENVIAVQGSIVDGDAIAIGELYEKGRASIVDSVQYLVACGKRLEEKKDSLKHGEWLPWLEANADVLGFETDRTAQMLMKAARKAESNPKLASDLDVDKAVEISRQLWGHRASQLVQQSLSNEHYTPKDYIEAARTVLGGIDLDPASCEEANGVVGARHFFTEADNGLSLDWYGGVWLNPPYGGLTGEFVVKLVESVRAGDVTSAIVLVNAHCTDTSWFQLLWDGVLCFTDHRINFYGDEKRSGSTHGSVFVYFGPGRAAFIEQFSQFGPCVVRA